MKKIVSILLTMAMVLTIVPINAKAKTNLPNSIYITQATSGSSGTCTLASATMMLRARAYLSKNDKWSSITESSVKPVAWGNGLKWSFTYSASGVSIKVSHESVSGISASKLKSLLNSHDEGIVLYCGKMPHAVFITDYEGDTFYCADPASGYSNCRRTLTTSALGKKYASQSSVLSNTTAYWYISSYDIKEQTTVSNPWIKASKSNIFSGESIDFTFGADNATSYDLTIKHYDETVVSDKNVKSGASYTFSDEGTYKAFITAKNGNNTVDSVTVSFYVVDALNFGSYFVTKLKNPVSGFYVAAKSLNNTSSNVYLASETSNSNNQWRFIRQEDCSYKVVNKQTGYCLGLEGAKTDNGTNIICSADSGADSQRWYIRKNISGYALVSKLKLSADLSITGNNGIYGDCIFDGANISLYSNDSVQSQRFEFEYTVSPINEWIKIDKTSLTSQECLKFDFGAGYTKKYTLHVELRDGSIIEKEINPGDSISFDKSGKCTAYIICELKDGTKINTDTVSFYNMKIYDLGKSFKSKIKNTASGFFIASQDFAEGYDNVFIASNDLSDNNVWKFEQQKDGSYKIINVQTGYVLELEDGNVADKTNVICRPDDNSDAQRWFITSNICLRCILKALVTMELQLCGDLFFFLRFFESA